MKKNILFFMIFVLLLSSCVSNNSIIKNNINLIQELVYNLEEFYVPSGRTFEPLPENTPIEIIINRDSFYEYDQIGIVSIGESFFSQFDPKDSLVYQLKIIRAFAQKKGANVVILIDSSYNLFGGNVFPPMEKAIRTFELGRKKN